MQEVHPQPENRPHARYPTDAPEPASVPGAAPAEIWARLPPGAYTRRWVFFRQALRSALLGICALPGRRAARRLLWAAGFALLLGGLAGAMGMLLTGTDTALLPACLGSFVGYLLVLAGLTGTRSAWRIRRQLRRFGGAVLTPPICIGRIPTASGTCPWPTWRWCSAFRVGPCWSGKRTSCKPSPCPTPPAPWAARRSSTGCGRPRPGPSAA